MKKRPLIIPIFIPQEGCKHRCVYCDQTTISGASSLRWNTGAICQYVQDYLAGSKRHPVQVAFYGGSFTAMPEARQRYFLEPIQDFLRRGQLHSIRLSTRPDAVAADNLQFLQSMGVKTIELGAQSLSDRVLSASARGHSSRQIDQAALMLRRHGFELGLQLMPGLPEDNRMRFFNTVDRVIALRPSFVRLYPTLVLAGTPLELLYRRGHYRPLLLSEAIAWCQEATLRFKRAGIPIIRTGLQPTVSLEQSGRIVAGPYHPAFGQLVKSAIWYDRIAPILEKAACLSRCLVIHASPQDLSDIRGQRNNNIKRWMDQLQLASLQTAACSQAEAGDCRVTTQ
jgi:histone acetyltransferase (RNA polymerase elongator complex component)